MVLGDRQTQQTPALAAGASVAQECYVPILAETFLTAKKAEGRSASSISFYREKLNIFMAHCDAQAVTQVQDITADFLRRYLAQSDSGLQRAYAGHSPVDRLR